MPDQCGKNRWLEDHRGLAVGVVDEVELLRIKMSLLGSLLGFAMLVSFLLTTGLLTVITGGAVAYAAMQNRSN